MTRKPISIKATRKKKVVAPVIQYPEGDSWKPLGWDHMWQMLYQKALPHILEYLDSQEQAA